ncbi:MAG: NAD(P)/FAD-dependent oxidoreductase [Acidobacteriota bacterium]|nr:NAD(P)/FAD-dependent oxidoreductase [Acidobacteriota bacterium]
MKIGIVGARVAGSYAGLLFSRLGHETILFDDAVEKEKPCGGGITAKGLRKMPWLRQASLPHSKVASICLSTPDGYSSTLKLEHPIRVYPRFSLDTLLRERAMQSGARLIPARVKRIHREKSAWAVETADGAIDVEFIVGADGANSLVRKTLLEPYSTADITLAIGYKLPLLRDPNTIRIAYQEKGFIGYIWSFPCIDHVSVGIGQWLPGARASNLRRRLDAFIALHHPEAPLEQKPYAARIPCLSREKLIQQKVCGENWALLGDAAGFTDGITAEGIYYALRSAELLAESLRRTSPLSYESAWRAEFMPDLETAAAWRDRFYAGTVLSESFIRRSLQGVKHSRIIQKMLDSLICGTTSYRSFLRSLVLRSPQILAQAILHKLRSTNDE